MPSRHPQMLASGISSLLQLSREQRQRMGAAARERIEREFSLPAVVRQYEELYEELVESRT